MLLLQAVFGKNNFNPKDYFKANKKKNLIGFIAEK